MATNFKTISISMEQVPTEISEMTETDQKTSVWKNGVIVRQNMSDNKVRVYIHHQTEEITITNDDALSDSTSEESETYSATKFGYTLDSTDLDLDSRIIPEEDEDELPDDEEVDSDGILPETDEESDSAEETTTTTTTKILTSAFSITTTKPIRKENIINDAIKKVYKCQSDTALAKLDMKMNRKFRKDSNDEDVKEYDEFIEWVESGLKEIGIVR